MTNRTVSSADPDETARYEPSHLDLHHLQRYPCWACKSYINNQLTSKRPSIYIFVANHRNHCFFLLGMFGRRNFFLDSLNVLERFVK